MTQEKGDDELAKLAEHMKELWTKFKTTCSNEKIDQTLRLSDLCMESLCKLSDKWSNRLIDGDKMITKFHEYTDEACQKNKSIEEKQDKLSEVLADLKDGRKEEADLMATIQELREELIIKSKTTHLQFIFRCVDHKDLEKPYILTLTINEEGAYEVISCFPPLDCIEELQQKVRETSNFSAFIANVRKAFIALTYK
ncbi:kinetochore protein Spc25 isoform X3 [Podarcis raffonei]|uniref:kinetochore protein Spc25 isoform X3 n=1 Tax=Podarcis raffonei TaxID=65483 RepID=UPI0023295239|nr:kinetochore protein Spc25 isoform X3 [Podarcis raffonei]